MSITNAFGIARSGLTSTSQWAELVSSNIANAGNENYGRRALNTATTSGGSVVATGITRETDVSLTRMYRQELARMTRQDAIASGLAAYSASLGDIGDEGSPVALLTQFQTSMDLLFNDPGDTSAQQGVLQEALSLARGLNTLSDDLDTAVDEVREGIKASVAEVNGLLDRVADLNRRIGTTQPLTEQRQTFEDQMAETLNALAEFIDFKTDPKPSGMVNIFTSGGTRLVEGDTTYKLSFVPGSGEILSDGANIAPPSSNGFREGRLAGQSELLNDTLPTMRLQLDEFARALIETFEGADASLVPGDAGLFTDAGLAYDPANLIGLAGRIAVSDAVQPTKGGSLWRLRDGVGAVTQGVTGSSVQVGAFIDALDATQTFDGATGLPTGVSLSAFGSALIADQQDARASAQEAAEGLMASAASIDSARLNAQGVNVDDELQQLLLIEKNYAANSRVVSTLSDMLDTLLAAV